MSPKLYILAASAPCRFVMTVAKTIGLELDVVTIALENHPTEELVKLNPQHTVPTLVEDDGFVLWDSHAIAFYLISKYGKHKAELYPEDIKTRAVINQRMYFEIDRLFALVSGIVRPIVFSGKKTIDQEAKDRSVIEFGLLETFLGNNEWVVGNSLTLADLCLFPTASTLNKLLPIDQQKFPNIINWFKRCEKLPVFNIVREGLEEFTKIMENLGFVFEKV